MEAHDHASTVPGQGAMAQHYDPTLVVASVLVVAFGALVALEVVSRASPTDGRPRRRSIAVAGAVLGSSVWSMHFVAMLALDISTPVSYAEVPLVASILAPVAASVLALGIAARPGVGPRGVAASAATLGLAVAAMHYLGMASMRMGAHIAWDARGVALSLGIAAAAALFAILLVRTVSGRDDRASGARRFVAAGVLALGAAGLHYAAMAAATFHRAAAPAGSGAIETTTIAGVLAILTLVTFGLLVLDAASARRNAASAHDLGILLRVGRDLARRGDARETVCRAACEVAGAPTALLIEPGDDGELAVTASHGMVGAQRLSWDREDSGARAVMRDGRRWFAEDVRTVRGVSAANVAASEAVSALCEPVALDEGTIGVLAIIWHERVRTPTARVADLVELLAVEAAVAIQRSDRMTRLEVRASTDGLTGLPNRRALDELLADRLAAAADGAAPLSVAMIDLDHFKAYNDEHGHLAGDRVLHDAADRWRAELRGDDVVGRFGGEEFLVVLPGAAEAEAWRIAERLRRSTADDVTCSIGIAAWDGHESVAELVDRADAALYRAKAMGRDRTTAALAG